MKTDFSGKRVVVTGGANGIGFAIAQSFVASGAAVWIFDVAAEKPAEAAERLGAQGCIADVTDRGALAGAFDQAGDIDIAVANAGIGHRASLLETSAEIWNRTLAVNLTGAFHTVQIAAERMKRRRRGSIVLLASTNSYDGEPDLAAYNASKAGLLGILHTAANELGPFGIRVNAVCPGLIRTRINTDAFSNAQVLSRYFRHIPMGRGGEPGEVAQAVLFLASGSASYITGAALPVDGGQMASKFGTWNDATDTFDGQQWNRGDT
ncbi:MAG: SDR family oxidoreductase [Acidobacteriota bacterium]|nr:SDR family oxidoreductase [Acidobacteriota bacterium]